MSARPPVSRRRFLALLAGTAAAAAAPAAAAAATAPAKPAARKRPTKPTKPAEPSPLERQFDEAMASTRATLETIRKHPLPPGHDLSVVFQPLARRRSAR